ncbi:MAG: hypothetical protein Q7T65_00685 [Thiobacillus sp.]|nr:hypothetical protein [Thiobacillus sp.]
MVVVLPTRNSRIFGMAVRAHHDQVDGVFGAIGAQDLFEMT